MMHRLAVVARDCAPARKQRFVMQVGTNRKIDRVEGVVVVAIGVLMFLAMFAMLAAGG